MAIIKSATIYLSLSLVVYVLFLGVSTEDVRDALNASSPSAAQIFVSIGAAAIPAMVVVLAIHALWIWIKLHTIDRERSYGAAEVFFGGISYAVLGPFRGPSALALNRRTNDLDGFLRRKSQAGSAIHFAFPFAILAYLLLGCFVVWRAYR